MIEPAGGEKLWDAHWEGLRGMDPRGFLESPFTRAAWGCLGSFLEARADRRVLEVGCGTGRFTCLSARDLPDALVVGVDISPSSLGLCGALKARLGVGNAAFVRADQFHLPFRSGCFDAVFSEGVIEHFPLRDARNYLALLAEMVRVIRRGGTLIAAVPNFYCLPHTFHKWLCERRGVPFEYGYEKSFTRSELASVFEGLGLRDIRTSGFYPAHGFLRFVKRRFGRLFRAMGALCNALDREGIGGPGRFARLFGFEIVVAGRRG